jgi:hypothetical protein
MTILRDCSNAVEDYETIEYKMGMEYQEREEDYVVVELYYLYSSPNIVQVIKSRRMSCAGNLACMGGRRDAYRILVGRSRRRWEDNIIFDL